MRRASPVAGAAFALWCAFAVLALMQQLHGCDARPLAVRSFAVA